MATTAIVVIDIITLAVAIAAIFLSWITMTMIKGDLKKVGIWFSLAITLIALRKIFDFVGEYYFGNAAVWNVLEDISYLLGIICFLYGSNLALKYFKKVSF